MFTDAIKLGDKLNLKLMNISNSKEYRSKLVGMNEDGTMSITMPTDYGRTIVLDLDSKYHVTFYTKKGLFICPIIVKRRYKLNQIYIADIKALDIPKLIQRRQYFRIACMIALELYITPEVVIESVLCKLRASNTAYGYTDLQLRIRALEHLIESDKREGTRFVEMKKAIITIAKPALSKPFLLAVTVRWARLS